MSERTVDREAGSRVVAILQDAIGDDPHPGVERVLHRLHPDTAGGPMRRDWCDAIQAADGELVGRFDVFERPACEIDSGRPQFVRPLGPGRDDGFDQLTPVGSRAYVRFVKRDKVLTLCGRITPTLIPYDVVRERFERARRVDMAPDTGLGSGEVTRS